MEKKLHVVGGELATPADAGDLDDLWYDPKLGDGLTDQMLLTLPVDKPKDFFRICPLPDYRRRGEILVHKTEGVIEAQTYIIAPSMHGKVDKARPATIVLCSYRDGSKRLWPIPSPAANEKDNKAWATARAAARASVDKWVKLVWTRGAYAIREAQPGYAPDCDWSKLPPWNELIKMAFGEDGIIRDEKHHIVLETMGAPQESDHDGARDALDGI